MRVRKGRIGVMLFALVGTSALLGFEGASAQLVVEDFVFTGAAAVEGYQGNLPTASVTAVDSTEYAAAAVGEFGARGNVAIHSGASHEVMLRMDGGVRQFAAAGFELRDYAPREWVGSAELEYERRISDWGFVTARGLLRGRDVHDRPPMPLFIQPAFWAGEAGVGVETRSLRGTIFDAQVTREGARYQAPSFAPNLLLLDRDVLEVEVGASRSVAAGSTVRVYAGWEGSEYPRQSTFDPSDPFRRDNTVRGGLMWARPAEVYSQLGVEVAANRSNSRRPEYDAFSIRGLVSKPVWGELDLTVSALLTGKRYVHPTEFARLIPGEEADNASVVYASLSRPLAPNLDGTLRAGWTRAETDIGEHYYQRLGLTFLMNYRP